MGTSRGTSRDFPEATDQWHTRPCAHDQFNRATGGFGRTAQTKEFGMWGLLTHHVTQTMSDDRQRATKQQRGLRGVARRDGNAAQATHARAHQENHLAVAPRGSGLSSSSSNDANNPAQVGQRRAAPASAPGRPDPSAALSAGCTPVGVAAHRRVHLPIIARGIARLEPYYQVGGPR